MDDIVISFDKPYNRCTHFAVAITRSGRFICPLCQHSYTTDKSIRDHLMRPHKPCPVCSLSFVNLSSHMRMHDGERSASALEAEAQKFVSRMEKRGYSQYQIERAMGAVYGFLR